ncbi:nitrogen fixation protein FixF [Thioclava sp. SK-1]|uniref:capsular polysaccharide export protein, LipB/KpsS family n=1 Tax=Thioclava sp. SK-1 TaxID=1889770 RepID=UPI000826B1F8|nr:nitrogen fixation protein FixF [Thioclava sp. SK-1]OCX66718.1 nitrogen fixation protein FixF [Thioclava sp. SK-1]
MFLKLDTGVIGQFDTVLEDQVETVHTGTLAVLKGIAKYRSISTAIQALGCAVLGDKTRYRAMIAGNLTRKRIRLPGLFGNPVVSGIYGWVKLVQAALLHRYLRLRLAQDPPIVIIFNGSNFPESVLADVSHDLPRVFVEGGFFPATLQIDPNGLNGANSVPRDPQFYLDPSRDFAANGLPQAVNNRPSKSSFAPVTLPTDYVFVPFQVPSDMQVTLHSPWIRDMAQFYDAILAAAQRNPDQTFVIKEHPSFKRSVIGTRPDHPRVIFANGNTTSDLIRDARAVITLNSTVGIEALLIGTPVITLGHACYNIDGLVQHAETPAALDATLRANWQPDPELARQFIGYLWNDYLVHGRYDDLPDDLGQQIAAKVKSLTK